MDGAASWWPDLRPVSPRISATSQSGYTEQKTLSTSNIVSLDGCQTGIRNGAALEQYQSNIPHPLSSVTSPMYQSNLASRLQSVHPQRPYSEHLPLIKLSQSEEKALFRQHSQGMLVSSSFSDLEGLDFSAPVSTRCETPSSMASSVAIYPDISAAFRELKSIETPRKLPSSHETTTRHLSQTTMSLQTPHMAHWNNNLAQIATPAVPIGHGHLSVGSASMFGPHSDLCVPNYKVTSQMPAHDVLYPGLTGGALSNVVSGLNQSLGSKQSDGMHNVMGALTANPLDTNIQENLWEDSLNFVPSTDFDFYTEWNAIYPESEHTFKTHKRQSSDLIQLDFESTFTGEENEYFSLEYFDPLHKKGRTLSVSSMSTNKNYFFAKPQGEADVVSNDRNTWVTFDEDGKRFNNSECKEQDGDRRELETIPVQNDEDAIAADTKGHEKLHSKLFIDTESESFCQMVVDLKKQYKCTDEGTNLGFIVSPMCNIQQESMSVKIIVYSCYTEEQMSFTSNVHSLVELIINHILFGCLNAYLPSSIIKTLKSADFILKINDRTEYLLSEYPLTKYSYTHDCLKMDQDLCFRIMRRQDVALPFLRTIDDDNQQLCFPQGHVKCTEVTRESLEILMDTFYKEVEKLRDFVLKDEVESAQHQSICQAVKAICSSLSKIETTDIVKSLSQIESLVKQLKANVPSKSSTLEHSNGGYSTLQRGSLKVSQIPMLENALESLVTAVKQLVRIYCQAFHTDFHLSNSTGKAWDPQDVSYCSENFIVQICSVHRIPDDWESRFDEYKIESSLFYGNKKLCLSSTSTCASLSKSGVVPVIIWDEWLTHNEMTLNKLPRESRLCLTLVGLKCVQSGTTNTAESQKETSILGGVTIQLFDRKGYLLQGHQLVPLQMNAAADPIIPFCSTLLPNAVLLQFRLPDFEKQIKLYDLPKIPERQKKSLADLSPEIQEQIREIMKKDCVTLCTTDQMVSLWDNRYHLHEYPWLLPWILQAAPSWDPASLPEINAMLEMWTTLQPMQSLELLLPQYPDSQVRTFAVECLRKMPTDDLIDFIPQLIQTLKYESYHSSPLARLLLEQSCQSVRFAHQFFWLLKGATQDSLYTRRYELMFVALVSVAGEALYQEFMKQEEIVKVLTLTAENVHKAKGGDKESILRKNLDALQSLFHSKIHKVLLPHNPGYEVSGLEMSSCSFFTSNAFPLKLVFKNTTEWAGPVYAMFKVGDDLRQDLMTMQIVRVMDRLWLKEGLDLKMITFNCLPTGPKRGFIEIITESDTLRKIQTSSGVTGSFKDRPIKDWLQRHNPTELDYQKAVENFTRSCAGYCVATYILGICDRHNDNIMLKQTGHLFHIDFNKILGDSQMFGNIKRDRVKFVLTSDMAYVINDGERQSDRFQHFIDMCCQAFNILRRNANLFINLFSLMLRSGVAGITECGIEFVRQALLPGITDTQAAVQFTRLIQESLSAKSAQINFFIHNLAQMKFSSHSEGTLLSFVPKVYNQQIDGRIKQVSLDGMEKRYTPEKHYIYNLTVERENIKLSSRIYRTFPEFVEFRNKLASLFPLINWRQLHGRHLLARSHVKSVAETRKTCIEFFLLELMSGSDEVSHSDIVYTFFHSLLRDEQEAHSNGSFLPKLRDTKTSQKTSPKSAGNPTLVHVKKGQVKLSLEYVMDSLHVLIIHAKDLKTMDGSELPSAYVKTYLLPDPEKLTKKKTKIIKSSTHPTYNELIEYKITRDALKLKTLQVTVWDHDVLKENNLLGAVYIRFHDLNLTDNTPKWYMLGNVQITNML